MLPLQALALCFSLVMPGIVLKHYIKIVSCKKPYLFSNYFCVGKRKIIGVEDGFKVLRI